MEKFLTPTMLLVSETDEKGIIRYANEEFCKMAGYKVDELEGKPHSIIRHPDMPKVAFKGLWETIKGGKTWRGFVKNRSKNGDYYWVYATVFPYTNSKGQKGYISVRKMATAQETKKYNEIYKQMNRSYETA